MPCMFTIDKVYSTGQKHLKAINAHELRAECQASARWKLEHKEQGKRTDLTSAQRRAEVDTHPTREAQYCEEIGLNKRVRGTNDPRTPYHRNDGSNVPSWAQYCEEIGLNKAMGQMTHRKPGRNTARR